MARPRHRAILLFFVFLLSASSCCAARQLMQETYGMEPAELEALMNPQPVVQQGDGSEGGGSTEAEPAHAVTFSKPIKAVKAGKGKGKEVPVVITAAPARKKAGKDMSAPELEWEKKAINASIAGDVRHLASEKAALRCGWEGSRRRGARPLYLTARYQNDKVLHDLVRDILFTHRDSIATKTKQFCAKVRGDVDKEVALRQNFNDPNPDVGKKGRGR